MVTNSDCLMRDNQVDCWVRVGNSQQLFNIRKFGFKNLNSIASTIFDIGYIGYIGKFFVNI